MEFSGRKTYLDLRHDALPIYGGATLLFIERRLSMLKSFPLALTLGAMLVAAVTQADETEVKHDAGSSRVSPQIVAHRGLLRHAPENTLANFRACLELRIGFEVDVRRAKDGRLVCVHDDTLERTTDGRGKVADHTLAELKRLDAGSWFDPAFRNERIATLDEVFALVAQYPNQPPVFAVDLKGDDEQIEQDVVGLAERHGVLDRLLFIGRAISFPEVRRRLRQANSGAHIGSLANTTEGFEQALNDGDADWVYVRYFPSDAEVARVRQAGKRLFMAGLLVTGRLEENWARAAALGIDAILTDYPLDLRRTLRGASEQ
jgi:glycerophosphoryl diester phosphodiesterase